jgi:TatD DNase family protein
MYFDSHVHLNDEQYLADLDDVIAGAIAANVTRMVCIGWDAPSSERAVAIAESHEGVFAAVGIHPEAAHRVGEEDFDRIASLLTHPKVVAVGEIGMDRYWDSTKTEVQKTAFIRQIRLAERHQKPIVVHMREATLETLSVLRGYKPESMRGVMHCYGGSVESLDAFLRLGMNISLAGPVTFKNARVAKEVAAAIPADRLMIETDAPYLAPHPHRGQRNESKYVPLVAAAIAAIRGISCEETARLSYRNAASLFRLTD